MPTNNAWNSNIPVELSKGGTNATSMATSTGIVKYDGTRLVTSSTAVIDASNIYSNTSQPAFFASINSSDVNVTGNATQYTVGTNVAFTEAYDIGGNFNTNGTFTAPVTGYYLFHACIRSTGYIAAGNANLRIVTNNRTYFPSATNPLNNNAAGLGVELAIFCIADMDSGHTATLVFTSSGEASNIVDIVGSSTNSYFGGAKIF